MAYKVLFAQDVAQAGKDLLKENGIEVIIAPDERIETIQSFIKDCDAVFSKTLFLGEETLRLGKNLKVVAKHGVGVDNVVDVRTATRLGLFVVNTPLANMESVAEHTITSILALSKNILQIDKATRNNDFDAPQRIVSNEVMGKTIGIIGLGNIGKIVARKAKMGLDMEVIGYDPYIAHGSLPDYIKLTPEINEIFKNADFISLHLGASKETNGLENKDKISLMKPSAFFINFARGSLVIEEDLVDALKMKKIKGAALDVFQEEPIRPDNPLLKLDNVLLSPHSAAFSKEAMDRMSYQGAMGIVEIFNGKKPTWCINYEDVRSIRND